METEIVATFQEFIQRLLKAGRVSIPQIATACDFKPPARIQTWVVTVSFYDHFQSTLVLFRSTQTTYPAVINAHLVEVLRLYGFNPIAGAWSLENVARLLNWKLP